MNRNTLEIVHKNSQFPTFQKPTVIGFYSLDTNRTYHSTADNLKYLYRTHRNVKLNLNEGFEFYQEKRETLENEEKLDALLSWLITSRYLKNIFVPEDPQVVLHIRVPLLLIFSTSLNFFL